MRFLLARVAQGLGDGAIVLMHDAAELGTHVLIGPSALPGVLDAIKERNLRVTPLREWL